MNLEIVNNNIEITSDLIDSYIANTQNSKLELFLDINCCNNIKQIPINITISDDPVIARNIESVLMSNKIIISTEELKDGIYNFTLIQTFNNGDIKTETACIFLDKQTKCKVGKFAAKSEDNFEVQFLYQALQYLFDCSDCYCDKACIIFNKLTKILTNDDCKCS